jgi:hypothetical protein
MAPASLRGDESPRRSEQSGMIGRAKTFGFPSGSRAPPGPVTQQMCEKLWTLHRCALYPLTGL